VGLDRDQEDSSSQYGADLQRFDREDGKPEKHRLKRKGEDWRRKLPRTIVVRGGETLRLLSDCRTYALNLDREEVVSRAWQHAAQLMLEAAEAEAFEDVVQQFERICFSRIS
jgi:hypothetical protein